MPSNNVRARIETVLSDVDTPEYARVMLLCQLNDHEALQRITDRFGEHLMMHARVEGTLAKIALPVVTALLLALALWIVSGGAAAVFGP